LRNWEGKLIMSVKKKSKKSVKTDEDFVLKSEDFTKKTDTSKWPLLLKVY
jgi:hypothetical protein